MPYCPKCGVKVDYNVTSCPLCDFNLPKIEAEKKEDTNRFPSAENIYPKILKLRKKKAFISIIVILFSVLLVTVYQDVSTTNHLTWSRYTIISLICSGIYLFFLFRFIPKFSINITGICINTLILLYFLDSFNKKIDWFLLLGIPITFMFLIYALIIRYIYKKSKRKGLNIVGYILIAASLYCIGIESSISLFLTNSISLHWSIIDAILLIPLAILSLYLHYGLPEKYRIKLMRKFHI